MGLPPSQPYGMYIHKSFKLPAPPVDVAVPRFIDRPANWASGSISWLA